MSRKAFEEWDRKVFDLPDRYYSPLYQGDFPSIDVKARWQAWQAATNAAMERAAEVCSEASAYQLTFAQRQLAAHCADAIRALKVDDE